MLIGVLKEIKTKENRVAMTPAGAEQLVAGGHDVLLETGAGEGSVFPNEAYENVGVTIAGSAAEVYEKAEMVMKVKEPLPVEYPLIRKDQVVFTYFHFAASLELTQAMIDSGCIAVAYETVECQNRSLPLLTPMSEVAGRMAIQEGAKYLEKTYGGNGILLSGVPGVSPGTVVVIGGGVVGTNAAKIACGLGAKVYLLDNNLERLRYLSDVMPSNCFPLMSNPVHHPQFAGRGRSGGWRGPDTRRQSTQTDYPRHARDHEKRRGDRRCGHRPGRVCGNSQGHNP
jgi:alanine dehydrogenase